MIYYFNIKAHCYGYEENVSCFLTYYFVCRLEFAGPMFYLIDMFATVVQI